MANTSKEGRPRIDEILPHHDFSASYDIRVNAPASVVYERLLTLDFSSLWLVRLLMTVRSGKRFPQSSVPADLRQRLRGTGFVILAETPGEELVIGVAGQFWRPDGGRCMDLTADHFAGFSRPGYAKVAWNFRLRADSQYSPFNRDKDQVLRTSRDVEIPNLLESCRPVLRPDAQGDS